MEIGDKIVFIYDNELVLKEEDDPADAVAYFYPSTMSSESQILLCGNLIALMRSMTPFMRSPPEIIKLKKIKFSLLHCCRFVVVMGFPSHVLSDDSMLKMCQYIIDVMLFYHSNMDAFFEDQKNQVNLGTILDDIFEENWTHMEFNVIPFFSEGRSQSMMLKTSNVLDFCCNHNGILSCALVVEKSVLKSLMSQSLTKLMLHAVKYDMFGIPIEDINHYSCRFLSVFVSQDDYQKLVRKQREKYSEYGWKNCDADHFILDERQKETVNWYISDASISENNDNLIRKQSESDSSLSLIKTEQFDSLQVRARHVIQSTGSTLDSASFTSDAQQHESSSDEVFNHLDVHNMEQSISPPLYSASESIGEENYFSAPNDLCKFLGAKTTSPTDLPSLNHLPNNIEEQGIEPILLEDKRSHQVSTSCNGTTSRIDTGQKNDEEHLSEDLSDQQELELFICKDGKLSMIILMEKSIPRRNEILQSIMDDCQQDLKTISFELHETSDSMVESDKIECIRHRHSTTTGMIRETGSCDKKSAFASAVAAAQNRFQMIPTLQKMTSRTQNSVFEGERAFDKISYLLK